jgi:hypothetical protein
MVERFNGRIIELATLRFRSREATQHILARHVNTYNHHIPHRTQRTFSVPASPGWGKAD